MSKSRWLVVAFICSLVAMPTTSKAQVADSTKAEAQDFMKDVVRALFGPNWNLFLHGGVTTDDRFVLQDAVNPLVGERALQSSGAWDFGIGGGVDILLRMGFRASYTYRSSDLNFKTDNGDGSNALDIDGVGTLKSQTVALEVMRYMLPAGATITPYGTLGIQGTWWSLDQNSPLVTTNGASPFGISPLFAFGIQVKASEKWSGRLEAVLSSGHNPFTGNDSFRALSGPTIDEPTGISRTDFRLAGVYHFGRPKLPAITLPVVKKTG